MSFSPKLILAPARIFFFYHAKISRKFLVTNIPYITTNLIEVYLLLDCNVCGDTAVLLWTETRRHRCFALTIVLVTLLLHILHESSFFSATMLGLWLSA